jgi:hypothetical protein
VPPPFERVELGRVELPAADERLVVLRPLAGRAELPRELVPLDPLRGFAAPDLAEPDLAEPGFAEPDLVAPEAEARPAAPLVGREAPLGARVAMFPTVTN